MKFYDLLGVRPDASKDDLRKAYKKLAVQHHPDKGGDENKFKEISHAYEVLADDHKRRMYDQLGDEGFKDGMNGPGGPGGPFGQDPAHDFFAQMFNNFGGFGFHEQGRGGGPVKRGDHVHNMSINLEQAYHGVTRNMKISLEKPCILCNATCNACQGRGHIVDMHRMGIFTQTVSRPCHICNGTGKTMNAKPSCSSCKGNGVIKSDHMHEIKIPAGVCTGHHIRINGFGEQPQSTNEIPGDMIINVVVDTAPFTRSGVNGRNLEYTQTIKLAETIIGKQFTVPHVVEPVKVDTTTFGVVVPGRTYVVKGKGMQGGDLHLVFNVEYPPPDRPLDKDHLDMLREAFKRIPFFAL